MQTFDGVKRGGGGGLDGISDGATKSSSQAVLMAESGNRSLVLHK